MTEDSATLTTQRVEIVPGQDLRFEIQNLPDSMLEIVAHAGPVLSQQAYKAALKSVGDEVSLPGFRKGKVPEEAVLKNFGSAVDKAWRQRLAELVWGYAIKLPGIVPTNPNGSINFALEEATPDLGGKIRLKLEVFPEAIIPDATQIQVPTCPITQELSTQAKTHMRRALLLSAAEWQPVEERPIELGDFVDLDIESLEEETPQLLYQDRRFEMNDSCPAWLRRTLLGAKVGQVIESMSELDERAAPLAREDFKPTRMRFTVRGVFHPTLPEFDEALAKKLGLGSVQEMETMAERQASSLLEQMRTGTRVETIRRALLKLLDFQVPKGMVQQEATFLTLHALGEIPEEQRRNLSKEQQQEIFQSMIPMAYDRVRMTVLGKKLVETKHAELQPAEFQATLQSVVQDYIKVNGQPMKDEESKALVEQLRGVAMAQALQRLALRWAESHGTPMEQQHPFIG